PEKSTKAVKPVVAGKAANAKASFGGKKAPADKSFGPKKAGGHGAKKQQEFDKPAGKASAGKPTIKPAHKPAPAVRAKAIDGAEQAPVNANPTDEKLQKVLARAGIGSRREMERAIEQGLVKVND